MLTDLMDFILYSVEFGLTEEEDMYSDGCLIWLDISDIPTLTTGPMLVLDSGDTVTMTFILIYPPPIIIPVLLIIINMLTWLMKKSKP